MSSTASAREGAPYQYDALGNLLGVWLPNGDVVEYPVDGRAHVMRLVPKALRKAWRTLATVSEASDGVYFFGQY